jgi:hypothetical protein
VADEKKRRFKNNLRLGVREKLLKNLKALSPKMKTAIFAETFENQHFTGRIPETRSYSRRELTLELYLDHSLFLRRAIHLMGGGVVGCKVKPSKA